MCLQVAKWDGFFQKHATKAPSKILVRGQPWGALEEMRLGTAMLCLLCNTMLYRVLCLMICILMYAAGHQLVDGLTFTLPAKGETGYDEAQPWVEILTTGTFSSETLNKYPVSYQTTDGWLRVIEESAEKHGMTWLHALHLGKIYYAMPGSSVALCY